MGLSEARGLVLFRVIRGGIEGLRRDWVRRRRACPGHVMHLRPERLQNRLAATRKIYRRWKGSSPETLKRLAILVFLRRSFLPSSISVSVMAAILRASVRRAMVGLMPLASACSVESPGTVPGCALALVAAAF